MKQSDGKAWPCRVCGFDMGADVWGGDENLNFTYDICDCCGAEAGTNDFNLEVVRRYRFKWASEGFQWFLPSAKPHGWSFEKQQSLIPAKWL